MSVLGVVESLWRYPVKSMRGEEVDQMFVGFGGVRGDRVCAFSSSANRADFPYFTGRDQREMLRYRPQFRDSPDGGGRSMIDVETPTGERFDIDDPALMERLRPGLDDKHQLTLLRSDRALTDAQPISMLSVQTVRRLGEETASTWDKRRFRANIYLDLSTAEGFREDELVGRSLQIGDRVIVSILQRDIRCMMITLDPDTAAKSPALLKQVVQAHGGGAGVYGSVLREGFTRKGDTVELLPSAD